MITFIVRRLLQTIPVIIIISVIIFGMLHFTKVDPAIVMMGGRQSSPEALENVREKYHLNEPIYTQYGYWISDAMKGDLGESFMKKQSVTKMIEERLPISAQLVGMSIVITLLLAIPLGVLAALKKNTWVDYISSAFSLICLSSPVFLTGVLFILLFSYTLNWLPAFGVGNGFIDNIKYMILPSGALSLNMIALNMKMTRGSMIDVMNSQYIQTTVAKGMPPATVVWKHAFKNALIPVLTVSSLQIGFLIVGTVLVEYTFGIGGLGSLIINAVKSGDYPVVQGCALFLVVVFLTINIIVDVLYAVIDPRIRY